MDPRRFRTAVLWTAVLVGAIALASCQGKGDNGISGKSKSSLPTESTAFSFKLSSYLGDASSSTPASATTTVASPTSTACEPPRVTYQGELLIVPLRHEEETEKRTVTLCVDETALDVLTIYSPDLPTRDYNFYFLLKSPTVQFGGYVAGQLIVKGTQNLVTLVLDPIIGLTVDSVEAFRGLTPFAVPYNRDLLSSYTHPRIGISIDGQPELILDIHDDPTARASDPSILLYLTPGPHTIDVRFFDGAIVKDVTADKEVTVPDPDPSGNNPPPEVVLEPLVTTAAYSYTPSGDGSGAASFVFQVPDEVVNEVGGPNGPAVTPLSERLQVWASLVGPANPLVEQALTLNEVIGSDGAAHYKGTLTVNSGFVPKELTWSLTFTALDVQPPELVGYCTATVSDLSTVNPDDPNSATLPCPVVLVERNSLNAFPVAPVTVRVTDSQGNGLSGSVVRVYSVDAEGNPTGDPTPLGITMFSSDPALNGTLTTFLPAGTYGFDAVDGSISSGGIAVKTLASGGPNAVGLTVPVPVPDTTPPGPVTNLAAEPGDGVVNLSWDNPSDDDFTKVYVRRVVDGDPLPLSPTEGERVTETASGEATDGSVVNGTTYVYALFAEDENNNYSTPAYISALPQSVPVSTVYLEPWRETKPTVLHPDAVNLTDGPIRVRVPELGKPDGSEYDHTVPGVQFYEGNPNRYLLFLRLGHVTCMYVGGKWDRHLGGVEIEDFFREAFKSPMCLPGRYHAGSVVTVRPNDHGDGDEDSAHGHHWHRRPEISATIVTSDPTFKYTRIGVSVEVVAP